SELSLARGHRPRLQPGCRSKPEPTASLFTLAAVDLCPTVHNRRRRKLKPSKENSMSQTNVRQKISEPAVDQDVIRPFRVSVPEEALTELRRRIVATSWPDKETVDDASQGVQLATIQALAHYWATEYNWRTCEARLNSVPQFITEIDGLDIHFI